MSFMMAIKVKNLIFAKVQLRLFWRIEEMAELKLCHFLEIIRW